MIRRTELRQVPTERRVRADDVVDTTRALLVWEPRRIVPSYAVPEDDLRVEVVPGGEVAADVEGMLHPGIPFAVHSAPGEPVLVAGRAGFRLDELPGYVVLDFNDFDAWYEEDERVFGHPRDPFHRVDVRRSSRPLRIELDGVVLAETTAARMLFETGLPTRFYVPWEDVAVALRPSARRSYCPYKGQASYWSSDAAEDVAWSYEDPLPELAVIKGLVAFWDETVDVFLDAELRSRPGGALAEALADEFGV
jgi:uncharacterized protein (DUF427 family)